METGRLSSGCINEHDDSLPRIISPSSMSFQNLKKKNFFFLLICIFCLCICTEYVSGASIEGSLELESRVVVNHHVGWEINPGPLQEHMLLTTQLSF